MSASVRDFLKFDGKLGESFSSGFRLALRPGEAMHYLKRRMLQKELPEDVIPTHDIYICTPSRLPLHLSKHGVENTWYFYTTKPSGARDDMIVVDEIGYWLTTSIHGLASGGKQIGTRLTRSYYAGVAPKGFETMWRVQEFNIRPEAFKADEINENITEKMQRFVLCKIYKDVPREDEGDGLEEDQGDGSEEDQGDGFEGKLS